jgi:hypothetical protein
MNTISRYYNATYLLQPIMVPRYQSQMYQICGVIIPRNSISPYTVFLRLQMRPQPQAGQSSLLLLALMFHSMLMLIGAVC